jgi:hypothetical protein
MLPVQSNANTVINENKPLMPQRYFAYIIEKYGVNPLFYGSHTETFAGLDEENLLR